MGDQVASFNVHDRFRFRVSAPRPADLRAFSAKFAAFGVDHVDEPDVEVLLGPHDVGEGETTLVTKESRCGRGFVHYAETYKVVRWRVLLAGLEDRQWRVRCHCRPAVGYEAFITKVLRPLFALKLATQGSALLHASAVGVKGRACVFAAFPGVGKTSACFHLARKGAELLGDENTLVDPEGGVWSFPLSIPVTTAMLRRHGLRPELSLGERVRLRVGDLVGLLSWGFLEKSLGLAARRCFSVAERAEPWRVYVLARSPRPFAIERLAADECARRLVLIQQFELTRVATYLSNYLVANPASALADPAGVLRRSVEPVVARAETYGVNLDEARLGGSFERLAAHAGLA